MSKPSFAFTDHVNMESDVQPLKLFNSQTKQKAVFEPIESGKVSLYVCGMTVYDLCHIGHARVMVAFDVLVRWLRATGYEVKYIRNITDIDDKIIQRANENDEDFTHLTARFIEAMHTDFTKLGCAAPDAEPKATEHIAQMQTMISQLIEKKHAYAADNGDVYFAVDSFEDYGKLSGRKLEDMVAGASERNNVATQKKHPFDFVLWKGAKPDEPHWQSPWGLGRPGWHIECSAMSTCCLGNHFDIHGGGHDLQFPHHENEIAQSEATTGETYVNTWMHVGFVNVDGEKMSKSLGNFFTIRDVLQKYPAETVRYFIMSSHYRSPINFSDTALDEAHASISRLYHALKAVDALDTNLLSDGGTADTDKEGTQATQGYYQRFANAMNDDLNTAEAFAVLFDIAREINRALKASEFILASQLADCLKSMATPLNVLQQTPSDFLQAAVGEDNGLTNEMIEGLIAQRQQAKQDKNYKLADELRQTLSDKGIILEDSRSGTTWRRD